MKISVVNFASLIIFASLLSLTARNSYALDFHPDNGKDQSRTLQKIINKLSSQGGGILHIKKGEYIFARIKLQSNIQLKIEKDTIIRPSFQNLKSWKSNTIFSLGQKGEQIKNVTVEGEGGNFIVKLPTYKPGLRVFNILNVTNFKIANMDIYDNYTKFSSLSFNGVGTDKAHRIFPKHGQINNISSYHSAYGYGTVQMQGGYDIKFNNIYSEGGVALRLETGYKKNNINQTGGVDKIIGHNIRCKNGSSAVMFSPHTIQNGTVQVENIKAVNCGFAVRIERGFISKKYFNPHKKLGTFAKDSYVKNIDATYGTTAQLKRKNFHYLPTNQFHLIAKTLNPDGESQSGPSIAGIKNSARYKVTILNLQTHNFKYNPPIIYYKPQDYKTYLRVIKSANPHL